MANITHTPGQNAGTRKQTKNSQISSEHEFDLIRGALSQSTLAATHVRHPPAAGLYRPQQRLLSSEEMLAILQEYLRCHPFRARFLLPLLARLVGITYDGTPEGLRDLGQYFRGVAFRP